MRKWSVTAMRGYTPGIAKKVTAEDGRGWKMRPGQKNRDYGSDRTRSPLGSGERSTEEGDRPSISAFGMILLATFARDAIM